MKRLILISILAFMSIYAYAQEFTSVVQLKNGTTIEGITIEDSADLIRLQVSNGNKRVIYKSDIASVSQKDTSLTREQKQDSHPKVKRFYQSVHIGYQYQTWNRWDFVYINLLRQIGYTCGYKFNDYLFAGGMIGFSEPVVLEFGCYDYSIEIAPNIRGYYPITGKTSLFLSLSAGIILPFQSIVAEYHCSDHHVHMSSNQYGKSIPFVISPSIGVEFAVSKKHTLSISAGISSISHRLYHYYYSEDDYIRSHLDFGNCFGNTTYTYPNHHQNDDSCNDEIKLSFMKKKHIGINLNVEFSF